MKTWKVAVLALSITVIADYGFAQSPNRAGRGMGCQQRFVELDTNKDENITFEEFMMVPHPRGAAYAKETFILKDVNEDGVLTKAEFCSRNGTN